MHAGCFFALTARRPPPSTDQGSGSKEEITISREGARSSADIDRMVKEAEEMAEQDKQAREKIDARNGLEVRW